MEIIHYEAYGMLNNGYIKSLIGLMVSTTASNRDLQNV